MAKKFVKIPLATKLRLVFSVAVLGIIAAALVVPWYFMELLAEQGVQRPGAELTRLRLNEWLRVHHENPKAPSQIAAEYTAGENLDGRKGPLIIRFSADMTPDRLLDSPARSAMKAFLQNAGESLAVIKAEDERGRTVYRCFRAVRATPTCLNCHGSTAPIQRQFQLGQFAALIDVTIPASAASGGLVWWTRGAFVAGVALAGLLAFILFSLITERIILRPIRHLRDISDQVTEGNLAVRSTVDSGDELQRLGESFNEMLDALVDQHDKLRTANRALDLKLDELEEVNVTLFQANKVKSEFLANISHELRTPLNSIIGFSDLLETHADERVRRYGTNIGSGAKGLLNIINELLDLAKIEAGKAEVRLDKASVTDLCETLLALIHPLADKKQITLMSDLDPALPLVVTDAGKLQQILYNLLSNAVKFTPAAGQVKLSAHLHAVEGAGLGEARHVALSVVDTGPGISEADQQRIFEKFYQAEASLTKETGGTGLGLAISRELAGLLGGRLTLKSSPGHGATFRLVLPIDGPGAKQGINGGS